MAEKAKEPEGPQPEAGSEPFQPFGKGGRMEKQPVVAPDGHENLSQDDIDARDS